MRNNHTRVEMCRLLADARYEVLPTASIEDKILACVPAGHTLTVTASAGKGLPATLDLAERLVGDGYRAVPHLAARMINGRQELEEMWPGCWVAESTVFSCRPATPTRPPGTTPVRSTCSGI